LELRARVGLVQGPGTVDIPALRAGPVIVRAPHRAAVEACRAVLEVYPAPLLRRAGRYPVYIWLLDRGEPVASAALLDEVARARRWHGGAVGLADCAGLTVPLARGLLVVAPWDRPAVLRHELGHALGALLNPIQRRRLERLYRAARAQGRLLVPLAGESIGEYAACGLANFARSATRGRLIEQDPHLATMLAELWQVDPAPCPALPGTVRGRVLDGLRALLGRPAAAAGLV
jgi:hypothetical protein